MSYQVESIENFVREAKRLKKKFPSLKEEIGDLINSLEENPFIGTSMKDGFHKIRLKIKSKGKSGGARVITCVRVTSKVVYLVSIYDKSEQTDISDEELDRIFKVILDE